MTKASPILLCPTVQLHTLPDQERDVLRRFWTEHVRGMDAKHDRRLRRFVRDLFNAEPGEGFQLYWAEERGGRFHRRHRAILRNLFDRQERFSDIDVMHDWLKLKCWHVEWIDGKPKPKTTNFDGCSESEIREFNAKLTDLIGQPWAQRYFWGHLTIPQRHEMADSVLADPNKNEGA
jgi:hypothetical protein